MAIGDPLVAGNSGAAVTALNITRPSAVTSAAYYCLAVFHTSLSGGTLTPPSAGWTLLRNPASSNHRAFVYGKYIDAGDAAASSYRWGLPASANVGGHMLFYPGVAASDSVVTSAQATGSSSTTWNAPSVDTTGVDGCRVVACYGANVSTKASFTPAKGHTRRALHGANQTPARRMVSTDATQDAGGSTGPITATSSSSGRPVMATVALRPAPATQQTPAVPQNLTAVGQPGAVLLDWDDVTTAGLDGYNVYRSTEAGAAKTRLNASLVPNSTYSDSTGTPGTVYHYTVTTVNAEAATPESGHSNEASAAPENGGGLNPDPTINESFYQPYASGGAYTSHAFTLAGGTTAGRLLVCDVAVDKNAGAFTPPAGWTLSGDVSGTGVSVARAIKVADGTESRLEWRWTNARNGSVAKVYEFPVESPSVETFAEGGTGSTAETSGKVGPPPRASTAETLALACVGVDSVSAWSEGSVTSWSDGFSSLGAVPADNPSSPGLEGAKLGSVASGSSPSTTATWANADEWAGILTLVRSGGAAPPAGTAQKPRVGAVTESSFTVAANFSDAASVRLRASTSADLSNPAYSPAATPGADGTAQATVTGLEAGTLYHYGWEIDGSDYGSAGGSVKTFPQGGQTASYAVIAASCSLSRTTFNVGDNIEAANPAMVVHLGDINYRDTNSTDPAAYKTNYDDFLGKTKVQNVVRKYPFVYLWSDHDYCGNASHSGSTGKAAVRAAYKRYWPHYALRDPAAGIDQGPFRVGRVWWVPLDCRSYRDRWTSLTDATRTMLGAAQKQWLKDFCLAHKDAPKVLMMDGPWIGGGGEDDHWGAYQTERTELVDFFAANGVGNLVVLAGDIHAVASDDGRNSPGGIPVFMAAPFDQAARVTGGPYQNGPFPASGTAVVQQYGRIDVTDPGGDQLSLTFRGRNLTDEDLIAPLTITLTAIGEPATQTVTPSGLKSASNLSSDDQGWLVAE
jgi:hypothetical protein